MISIILPWIREPGYKRVCERLKDCGAEYEIVAEEDKGRIGVTHMVKKLVAKARGDYYCYLGDDTLPQPNFLKHALEDMKQIEWGLVGLNDNTGRMLPTHWLADKRLLAELDGELFHTGYTHCCCDVELMERCIDMNRFIYSTRAVVLHDQPLLKGEKITDPDLIRVYSPAIRGKDQALLKQRRKNGWKSARMESFKK